ncbi:DEAD/DEAH box helicase family protein (plasmid) [Polymorphobacter sp. PAMC 29334]|uniref:type I restriction endonuclease subunit R n=1 Tax=Polymorphobacter sp. PAMC 29334 TaxID=2862331 RepID=UPI001C78D43D|nr:DEAD/DEAH box helicase family protein [Polymorphobacter sp. PAMC 29334]QYE37231.1 DEAD/DEAH box helicase family protein [Polymorphobacter sp. PAMC 29334]
MGATPEAKARAVIDVQLAMAGWLVQDRADMNRNAGLGVAVREYQLATGPCDYLLFVAGKACGVVEAKPAGVTLSGVAEQARGYQGTPPAALASWGSPLRFDYEASGTEMLFSDRVDPQQRSRRMFGFHRPETLHEWLKSSSSLRARLANLPPLIAEGLRDCQVEAITGIEDSLKDDRPRALVQMATGAGKTFTAATLSYRLLAHAGARRILFLVDRNNLGRQTLKEFQTYRPPGTGRLFTELYNVQRLGAAGLDAPAKVVISTIQRVFAQLTGAELSEEEEEVSEFEKRWVAPPKQIAYRATLPPETFDFIVVDECHRSIYGTWRQVLDYFDAQIIGLTATPTVQTMAFFGENLVAEYPYEKSVIDKVNVPFEVFRIRTQIGEFGSKVDAGYTLPVRDRHTRRQHFRTLDEDLVYGPEQLDRSVIARNQIRTCIETYRDTLFTELFPGRTEVPKTLIFAKDDHHAEEIVTIVREVFGRGNAFAKKITYRVGAREAELLIAEFRNGYDLRIAVTVDMIATGTDVKAIEALIFLRDVQSSTYFIQMCGRGVRTIDPADLAKVTPDAGTKERFVLVDAVGVMDHDKGQPVPLERERTVSFDKLLEQVASGRNDEDVVATLAVRLATLDRKLDDAARAKVEAIAGQSLSDFASRLADAIDVERIEAIARARHGAPPTDDQYEAVATEVREAALAVFDDPQLRTVLIELKRESEVIIDDISRDVVISSAYSPEAATKLTTDFRTFLDENRDQLTALRILYGLPAATKRLTYASLEELRDAMLKPPWLLQPLSLWAAYRRLQGDKVRANPARTLTDIVALVRFATGSADTLAPLSSDIAGKFNLWLGREGRAGRSYDQAQLGWLEAIRDHLAANVELSVRDVQDSFADRGGILGARRAFGPRLDALLDELQDALVA